MLDLFYTFISYFFNIVDFLAYYVLLSHKLTSRFSKKTQLIAYCITYLLWFSAELSTKIFPNIPLKLLFLLFFFFEGQEKHTFKQYPQISSFCPKFCRKNCTFYRICFSCAHMGKTI